MGYIRITIKLFWLTLCTIGNVFQIAEISNQFFQYDIVSTVSVHFPDIFTAPAVSFCFNEIELVNFDKLQLLKPKIKKQLNLESASNEEVHDKLIKIMFREKIKYQAIMFSGLSIKQRMDIVSTDQEIISSCGLTDPVLSKISDRSDCSEMYEITSYRSMFQKCYQFNYKSENYSMDILNLNRAKTTIGLISFFKPSAKTLNITLEAFMTLNMNQKYTRLGYLRFLALTGLDESVSLTYQEYSNTLLSRPYITNCRNYAPRDPSIKHSVEDIIDRGTCYESCMENKTRSTIGKLFPGMLVFGQTVEKYPDMVQMTVGELISNPELVKLDNDLSIECNKLCESPTCADTFYIPMLRSRVESPDPVVLLYIMQSPKIDTSSDAKLSLVSYLTNIFSTFGFWIGLSAFSIIDIVADMIDKINKSVTGGKSSSLTRSSGLPSSSNLILPPSPMNHGRNVNYGGYDRSVHGRRVTQRNQLTLTKTKFDRFYSNNTSPFLADH